MEEFNQDSKSKTTETSHKYVFYRKPSIKKKGPEVKQTKTSIQRMLKANPLLYGQDKEHSDVLKKDSESTTEKNRDMPNHKKNVTTSVVRKRLGSVISSSSEIQVNKKTISNKQSPIKFNEHSPKFMSSTRCELSNKSKPCYKSKSATNSQTSSNNSSKNKLKENKNKITTQGKVKNPIRRSLSAQHFERKKGLVKAESDNSLVNIKHSSSIPNMNKLDNDTHCIDRMSPLQETSHESSLIFKTPSAYERRSIISTPLSEIGRKRSLYRPSTPLPTLHELQKRLNDWLVRRGKSISLFHHLKSFDIPKDIVDEEDKENAEINQDFEKGSYEDLQINQNHNNGIKGNSTVITSDNIEQVAKSALEDLLNLVQDGYPLNHCESWLQLIRERYSQLQEEPEYWECRAAIEEARGNISKAVECYKTAIIQGAEVQEVDKSLDVLLKKFSLLNINTESDANQKLSKERERIIKDARHIFKSSIIKFAVQEKKLKKDKSDVKLVATPVRRSTRLSRSGYIRTPGVTICSTLKDLDNPVRASLNFQVNKALN